MNDKPTPAPTPAPVGTLPTSTATPPPPPAPAPAPSSLTGKAQDDAQKKLVEKLHGPQGTYASDAARAHAASTSTLLTTDAHVGKRTGEPHKEQAMEDLKVGAAMRTIDETKKVETVEIAAGTPANKGKPTDVAVLGAEGKGLAPAPLGSVGHGADAVGVTEAIAAKTGKTPGEATEPVEGAKPGPGANPTEAAKADEELKGKAEGK